MELYSVGVTSLIYRRFVSWHRYPSGSIDDSYVSAAAGFLATRKENKIRLQSVIDARVTHGWLEFLLYTS